MKKLFLPVVAIIALMTMSFTTNTSKMQIIKTENGEYLTNTHLLSVDDIQTLKSITVTGAGETSQAHTYLYKNVFSTTITKHKDIVVERLKQTKLDEILAKY